MYTSFEFSKKLFQNGCKLETNLVYINKNICMRRHDALYNQIPAYDILNDLCVKYAKEIFGEEVWQHSFRIKKGYRDITTNILIMIQEDESQKKIEKYIWDNCLFNKENNG